MATHPDLINADILSLHPWRPEAGEEKVEVQILEQPINA